MATLRVAFLLACWTATAAPLSLLGSNFFPTVLLNLEESNHSDTKCVTVNGRDLCTTITNCPREAYECTYVDPTRGHNCGLNSYQCACTATYGNSTCHCDVSPHAPYWVSTRVSCPSEEDDEIDLSLGDTNAYCTQPVGFYYSPEITQLNESACYRGEADFSLRGWLQVNWECARHSSSTTVQEKAVSMPEPDKECTCQARYRYQKCSSCQPCPHGEPGSFRAVCPGLFMDCFQTYSVWDEDKANTSSATTARVVWALGVVAILLSWNFSTGMNR